MIPRRQPSFPAPRCSRLARRAEQLCAAGHTRVRLLTRRYALHPFTPPYHHSPLLCSTPPAQVQLLANQLPAAVMPRLLSTLGDLLPQTPHIEHLLQ